jgi:hypothetical protein
VTVATNVAPKGPEEVMLYAAGVLAEQRYKWHPPSKTYLAVFMKCLFQ